MDVHRGSGGITGGLVGYCGSGRRNVYVRKCEQ